MSDDPVHAGKHSRPAWAWTLFWVVSALSLGAGLAADLMYGAGDHLVAVVASSLCVVGVAAGLMASPASGSDEGLKQPSGGWSVL